MGEKYCSGCGENVETYIDLQTEGTELVERESCVFCGMAVEDVPHEEEVTAGTILLSDDSPMMREMLADAIMESKLAEEVVASDHGAHFLTDFTTMAIEKKPVSLLVLDVSMPVFNGVNAAIAVRAVEKSFKMRPTPIMFFTAHKCDDSFKKVLNYCRPALYLNKGSSASPAELTARVSRVIRQLLAKTAA